MRQFPFVGLSLLWPLLAAAGEPDLRQVLPEPLPDPYVFQWLGEWTISGTGNFFYHGATLRPESMTREELQLCYEDATARPPQGTWGFIPYRHRDGSWHGYATLHYGNFQTVVAHFLPESGAEWKRGEPITRWRFDKVLVGDRARGKTTAYESKILTDDNGVLYLVYSASAAPHKNVSIWVQKLLDPGQLDPAWEPRTLLDPGGYRSEDRNPGYIQIVEGANIAKIGSKYVLFYSVGDFALNNYKLGVAYSDHLIPPPGQSYCKVLIPDRQNDWKNSGKTDEIYYLLQSEQPHWPNYCRQLVSSPGLGNLAVIDGAYWLLFHGYKPRDVRRRARDRYVWMLPLKVNIDDRLPMQEWLQPDLGDGPVRDD